MRQVQETNFEDFASLRRNLVAIPAQSDLVDAREISL